MPSLLTVAEARRTVGSREWLWLGVASSVILALTVVLNAWGYADAPPNLHFGGLVYNWQDSNTYLAKIRQGMHGEWLFTLPYSAEPGPGVYVIYLNYLLLGHIATFFSVEADIIFHAARLISGAIMLASLYAFVSRFFTTGEHRRFAFLAASITSGLGWLALLFGRLTPDVWQAELSPFLAILSNPHYPLAVAAFLWLINLLIDSRTPRREPRRAGIFAWTQLIVGGLILAITQPYALLLLSMIAGLWIVLRWRADKHPPRAASIHLVALLLCAAPFAAYDLWLVATNPAMAGLNAQDVTVSAPPSTMMMAGGVPLVLGVLGCIVIVQRIRHARHVQANDYLLLGWLIISSLLMYFPHYMQQRRFAFALFIPLGVLATYGLQRVAKLDMPVARFALIAFSSLTHVVVLLMAYVALSQHPLYLFLSQNEWNGLLYLRARAAPHMLVLASPDMGLFIPAWSDQRVIYGHPYETLNARARAEEVEEFFKGRLADADRFLAPVDFIFVGPREKALGVAPIPSYFSAAFTDGDVTIYQKRP